MYRAAASPEQFLTRGFAGFARSASRSVAAAPRGRARTFSVELPRELVQLLDLTGARPLGDFIAVIPESNARAHGTCEALFAAARRKTRATAVARARLCAYLAGTVPFGTTRSRELWVYVLGVPSSPSRGVIATLDPAMPGAPRLLFRGASTFALACALDESATAGADASRINEVRTRLPSPGVAEQEGVRAAFERAILLLELLTASDAGVRRAAKTLAPRPFEPPHPPAWRAKRKAAASRANHVPPSSATRMLPATGERVEPLALGALVEAFFRKQGTELDAIVRAQLESRDAVVRGAALLLTEALVTTRKPRTALARDLARRRAVALRAAAAAADGAAAHAGGLSERTPRAPARGSAELTRRIIDIIDSLRPATDPLATTEPREEALRALSEVGDRSAVPGLVARAVTGDVGAVDMLAALGDPSAVAPLVGLLHREPQRHRLLETAVVRALAALDAGSASHALCTLLAENPMPSWREGIERGVLVKELVTALGALRDETAGPALLEVLSSTSQEYRAILPAAAWALGRIHHLPALATLERLLSSPKEPPTCEAIWAVGAIGAAHETARIRAGALLDGLSGLEPGAEMVRLTALQKIRVSGPRTSDAPRTSELRMALERALWEPAFRQEETSRRRTWALRSLEELASKRGARTRKTGVATAKANDLDPYFLGHEAVRYFVTRDAHALRRAAEDAFAAWSIPVPETRRYYVFEVERLERRGGLGALHEALRDPLGIFRHNVATRLAERGDPSSVRPLAEATARLFAEPPTSTYEYDDAPRHLVAFVRALAKMNRPEGNDVLIEGLRAGNHQVRAVVAENAPDDERFVPELMAMLGDPRSFLRSRAERSLASLNASPESRGSSESPPRRAPL